MVQEYVIFGLPLCGAGICIVNLGSWGNYVIFYEADLRERLLSGRVCDQYFDRELGK